MSRLEKFWIALTGRPMVSRHKSDASDPFTVPEIARMGARELADLPFDPFALFRQQACGC